jgi:hypothetical protein
MCVIFEYRAFVPNHNEESRFLQLISTLQFLEPKHLGIKISVERQIVERCGECMNHFDDRFYPLCLSFSKNNVLITFETTLRQSTLSHMLFLSCSIDSNELFQSSKKQTPLHFPMLFTDFWYRYSFLS